VRLRRQFGSEVERGNEIPLSAYRDLRVLRSGLHRRTSRYTGGNGSRMDDQRIDRDEWGLDPPRITSTPRERILAGVLSLVYIGSWALVGYLHSIPLKDPWAARAYWVVYATWCSIMLVLPMVVVCLFFGIDRAPAWLRGRFSLRALLILTTLAAVVLGVIASLVE
jgi:hypothetical protein